MKSEPTVKESLTVQQEVTRSACLRRSGHAPCADAHGGLDQKLDAFLTLNDRDILTNAGRISHEMAQTKAELEYGKFKALAASDTRPVDEEFEQAARALPKRPRTNV